MSELLSVLLAHDAARSAGRDSATSGLEALASITSQLKNQLGDPASTEIADLAGHDEGGAAAAVTGSAGSRDRVRTGPRKPSPYGNRAIAAGQQEIITRLDKIELRQMEQAAGQADERRVSSVGLRWWLMAFAAVG